MLTEKMLTALNDQINFEVYSGYIYASMAAFLDANDFKGFSAWMKSQTTEEMSHAMKMYRFVNDRGERVTFHAIPAPQAEWDSVKAAFENALHHERIVTGRINDLMDIAVEERDHATQSFLRWFIDEQVEEEATVDEWVKMIAMAESHPASMMMLDREAGARVSPVVTALATPGD